MKKIILILVVLFTCTFSFAQDQGQTTGKEKLLVYYFHLTNRCPTCIKIEATTQKVLKENFNTEMENGTIVFKSFNVEVPENKTISEKYQAYGATLALTKLTNGKEQIEDMTNFAFTKIHNEEAFVEGLKNQIEEFLK